MSPRLTNLILLLACVAGCSGSSEPAADGGEPPVADAGEQPPAPAPFDPAVCEMRPALEGLEMAPAAPPIFQFVNSPCTKLPPARVLLVNATDSTLRIEAVGTGDAKLIGESGSAAFHATVEKLPRDLEPQQSLPVEITFEADAPGVSARSELWVIAAEGCQHLGELQGASIETGSGTTVGPLAIDFGVLRPGEVSKPVAADFTFLPNPSIDSIFFTVTDASPQDVFEVVTKFDRDLSMACAEAHAAVQMKAPSEPGLVIGSLYYQLVTSTARGVGVVPLRGLVKD